jgi:hypothetical protein
MCSYLDSITFANHKITELLDQLIAKSSTPLAIILQADHDMSNPNLIKPAEAQLSFFTENCLKKPYHDTYYAKMLR